MCIQNFYAQFLSTFFHERISRNIQNFYLDFLTLISKSRKQNPKIEILPSVFHGNKIQTKILRWSWFLFLWNFRENHRAWFTDIKSTWKFCLDFVSRNHARWHSQNINFLNNLNSTEIDNYGFCFRESHWATLPNGLGFCFRKTHWVTFWYQSHMTSLTNCHLWRH